MTRVAIAALAIGAVAARTYPLTIPELFLPGA
jgi:hypothetical protein